jgi:hypothetical protein
VLIKDLKELLKNCNDDLEVEVLIKSHEHLYNSVEKEIGIVNIEHIIPINSCNIKYDDGYGVVILSNIKD